MGERLAVHLSLRWGDMALCSTSTPASRVFVLGEGGDWPLPPEVLGAERFELLRRHEGQLVLAVPPGATAWVEGHASPFRPAGMHRLDLGTRGRLDLGSSFSVELEVGPEEPRVKRGVAIAAGALAHQALSAGFHLGAVALLALLVPTLGADTLDAEEYADRTSYLLHALDGSAANEREHRPVAADDAQEPAPGEGRDERAGEVPETLPRGGHVAAREERARPDPMRTREAALREAALGVVGLLSVPGPPDTSPPTSSWGREASVGDDLMSARIFGAAWGDAFEPGGLHLSGAGEGGGGRGEGIGLGSMGTFGMMGEGHGTLRQGHVSRCRDCDGGGGVWINGRLPPETIQRIVRQSFGRFRYCYQKALDHDPTLETRVETKFLVARDGSVPMAVSTGPQPLAGCVQAAFSALSFPEPAGGVVTVIYPLSLRPDSI